MFEVISNEEIAPQLNRMVLKVPRVAKARNIPLADVRAMVAAHITGRTLGILGEPRVNVLELNRALDAKSR